MIIHDHSARDRTVKFFRYLSFPPFKFLFFYKCYSKLHRDYVSNPADTKGTNSIVTAKQQKDAGYSKGFPPNLLKETPVPITAYQYVLLRKALILTKTLFAKERCVVMFLSTTPKGRYPITFQRALYKGFVKKKSY